MHIDDSMTWEDYEAKRLHDEIVWEFGRFLRQKRRVSQNAVKSLFPLLATGISVQTVTAACREARYWIDIPDEWAEDYTSAVIDDYLMGSGLIRAFGMKFWIEEQVRLTSDIKIDKSDTLTGD